MQEKLLAQPMTARLDQRNDEKADFFVGDTKDEIGALLASVYDQD